MREKTVRVATRGSLLALTQTNWVVDRLRAAHPGVSFAVETYRTTGDKVLDVALNKVGGKGLFTKELEDALLEGKADLAVHSLKDLPTELPEGLVIGAIPEREDPRDAVVTRTGARPAGAPGGAGTAGAAGGAASAKPQGGALDSLPAGARVGTSSVRRVAQLRALRPDLTFAAIRGNVDTRLRKLDGGEVDALVMAAAGLHRAGFGDRITEYLSPERCLPAPGQGALAIEVRAADGETGRIVAAVHDNLTAVAVHAERALLARLQGGCSVPVGALAAVESGHIHLRGLIASPDGARLLTCEAEGPEHEPAALGRRVAEQLLALGGEAILSAARG
jgi:hydroxymethylbilane synthase